MHELVCEIEVDIMFVVIPHLVFVSFGDLRFMGTLRALRIVFHDVVPHTNIAGHSLALLAFRNANRLRLDALFTNFKTGKHKLPTMQAYKLLCNISCNAFLL